MNEDFLFKSPKSWKSQSDINCINVYNMLHFRIFLFALILDAHLAIVNISAFGFQRQHYGWTKPVEPFWHTFRLKFKMRQRSQANLWAEVSWLVDTRVLLLRTVVDLVYHSLTCGSKRLTILWKKVFKYYKKKNLLFHV